MINLLYKTYVFAKHIKFAEKKEKPALLTRTCPPGLALAGPDMSTFRLLIQFRTLRVQNLVFHIISK